jgi:hypothetical protein
MVEKHGHEIVGIIVGPVVSGRFLYELDVKRDVLGIAPK